MKRFVVTLATWFTILSLSAIALSSQDNPPSVVPIAPRVDLKQVSGTTAEKKSLPGKLEVLSDTQGVDLRPYLSSVVERIRKFWYGLVPVEARSPVMKQGKVSIEFQILQDGHIQGLKYSSSSGDQALDRAAYGGITESNPFSPLPAEFKGSYLALRFNFLYNLSASDLKVPSAASSDNGPSPTNSLHNLDPVLPPQILFAPSPQYTKRARSAKEEGTVVLSLMVNERGQAKEIKVTRSLSPDLDKKAVEAVKKKWAFKASTRDGKAIAAPMQVEVVFKLD